MWTRWHGKTPIEGFTGLRLACVEGFPYNPVDFSCLRGFCLAAAAVISMPPWQPEMSFSPGGEE